VAVIENLEDFFAKSHERSDVDNNPQALHHTLGNLPFQAAPGNHTHPAKIGFWRFLNVNVGLGANVWTRIPLQAEIWSASLYSSWGTWNAGANQLEITKAGIYLINAGYQIQPSSNPSTVYGRIRHNGVSVLGRVNESIFVGAANPELHQSGVLDMVPGGWIAIDGYCNTGGIFRADITDETITCQLQVIRLGDYGKN
jgi:hypothetical protein